MKNTNTKYTKIVIITLIIVIISWGVSLVGLLFDFNSRGTFGDMFGAVNALFSGLAFAGIIITMYMQRDDLRNQREQLKLQLEELKLQRKEQEDTRIVFKEQAKIMADQQNDSVFFNLLTNHRQLVESFKTSRSRFQRLNQRSTEIVSGYQVLEEIADHWLSFFREYSDMYDSKVIWKCENTRRTPKDLVGTSNTLLLLKEVVHISDFIKERFTEKSQLKFYQNTLNFNLLDAEKFIFASWFAVVLNREEISPIGMELYDNENYVDLAKAELPAVSIRKDSSFHQVDSIEISTDGVLKKCFIVLVHNEHANETLELKSIPVNTNEQSVHISIREFVRETSLGIDTFPFEEELGKKVVSPYYYLILDIWFKDELFRVPFKFRLYTKDDYQVSTKELKLFDVAIKNNDKTSMSKVSAIELIEKISKLDSH